MKKLQTWRTIKSYIDMIKISLKDSDKMMMVAFIVYDICTLPLIIFVIAITLLQDIWKIISQVWDFVLINPLVKLCDYLKSKLNKKS